MALENHNTTSSSVGDHHVMDVYTNGSSFFENRHHHLQQSQLCINFGDNIRSENPVVPPLGLTPIVGNVGSFVNLSPPPVSGRLLLGEKSNNNNNKGLSGRKRKRNNERALMEKPKEVIHVRAKRGQATDSHSLAERVRREKINERLRCLQDLVPGCYKTMGMAVMLDVITNYVRSLQNQIEFLSMKLSAASLYYDFNSDLDAAETLPAPAVNPKSSFMQGTNECDGDAQDIERMAREGYGGPSYFHSTWSL